MANENKNTKELVSPDEEATAELQELTLQQVLTRSVGETELEDDADTFEFERMPGRRKNADVKVVNAELEARHERISQLQFDLEQLRSRFNGLQTEVNAREEITADLQHELAESREQLTARSKLLQQRDRTIKELKAEIRERESSAHERRNELSALTDERDQLDERLREVQGKLEALSAAERAAPSPADDAVNASLADVEARNAELAAQLARTEAYADEIRIHLADRTGSEEALGKELNHLRLELAESQSHCTALQEKLDTRIDDNRALGEQISMMQARRNDELRSLRQDLASSKDTLAQLRLANEQLSSELIEARDNRARIEKTLAQSDGKNQRRIAELESELTRLSDSYAASEAKLAAKSEAVSALLAKVSQRPDSVTPAETGESRPVEALPERSGERVNRMLIGHIDNQELRFPLFKKRLTIGRTQQNDIQLNVPYISRRHAVILTEGDETRVVDWGSKNGVYVNSKRVTEHFLSSGDRVTIGNAEFRYEERARRES